MTLYEFLCKYLEIITIEGIGRMRYDVNAKGQSDNCEQSIEKRGVSHANLSRKFSPAICGDAVSVARGVPERMPSRQRRSNFRFRGKQGAGQCESDDAECGLL